MVQFHAHCRDLLECDLSGRQVMVHRHFVRALYPPLFFVGEEGFSTQKFLHILSCHLCPPYLVLFQRRPNSTSQTYDPPLIPPGLLPHRDSLINKSLHLRRYPRVVARHLFVCIQNAAPQLSEDLVHLCPCLLSRQP